MTTGAKPFGSGSFGPSNLSLSPSRCNTMAMKITMEKKMPKFEGSTEGAEEAKSLPIKPPKAPWKDCGWCGNKVRPEIALGCAWCRHIFHRYCYQEHRPCRGEDDPSEAGQKMQCNDYNFDDLNDTAAEEARRRKA